MYCVPCRDMGYPYNTRKENSVEAPHKSRAYAKIWLSFVLSGAKKMGLQTRTK